MPQQQPLRDSVRMAEYELSEHFKTDFTRRSSHLDSIYFYYDKEDPGVFSLYFYIVTASGHKKTEVFSFYPDKHVDTIKPVLVKRYYEHRFNYRVDACTVEQLKEALGNMIKRILSGFRREFIAKYYIEKMMKSYSVIKSVRFADNTEDQNQIDLVVEVEFPKVGLATVPLQIKSSSASQLKHKMGINSRKIPSIVIPSYPAYDKLAPRVFDLFRSYVKSGHVVHVNIFRYS
ncbi:MAG: hypothetical protein IT284_01095 [Bacteroidetes bacterium]|nr:hypothetical protein [Bacteroidota bacterium]